MTDMEKSKKTLKKTKNNKSTKQSQELNNKSKLPYLSTDSNGKKKLVLKDPKTPTKEEEDLKKIVELKQKIQEKRDQLTFEHSQRQKFIDLKNNEIKQKENEIKNMELSNIDLNNEIQQLRDKVSKNKSIIVNYKTKMIKNKKLINVFHHF